MTDTTSMTFQNINLPSCIALGIKKKGQNKTKTQRELHNAEESTFLPRKQIGYQCSGKWRVDWFIDTNISEELDAYIFVSVQMIS